MANLIFSNCLPRIPVRFESRSLVSLKISPYSLEYELAMHIPSVRQGVRGYGVVVVVVRH